MPNNNDPMVIAADELRKNGWQAVHHWLWKSPSGALFLGPNQAHRMMKEHPQLSIRRQKQEVNLRPTNEAEGLF